MCEVLARRRPPRRPGAAWSIPGLADRLVRRAQRRRLAGGADRARARGARGSVAQGLSNRAMAERLVVTGGTVETHIRQIFAKLDLREERRGAPAGRGGADLPSALRRPPDPRSPPLRVGCAL